MLVWQFDVKFFNRKRGGTAIISVNAQHKNWSNIHQKIFTKNLFKQKKSAETLSAELKPVPSDSYEFWNQQKKVSNWTLSDLRSIKIPIYQTKSKKVPTKNHLEIQHRQFGSMIEEFKSIVFEKVKLEYRDICILKAVVPLLFNKNSNADVETKFMIFRSIQSVPIEKLSIDSLIE